MGAKLGDLTTKQRKAVEAIAAGETSENAALLAGVALRTVQKWKAEHEVFKDALRELESQALSETARRLTAAGVEAVDTLSGIATDTEQKAAVRVAAASKILDALLRYKETAELLQRIEALEAMLGGLSPEG